MFEQHDFKQLEGGRGLVHQVIIREWQWLIGSLQENIQVKSLAFAMGISKTSSIDNDAVTGQSLSAVHIRQLFLTKEVRDFTGYQDIYISF